MEFEKRLARWLRSKLLVCTDSGPVEKIIVRQIPIGGRQGNEVETYELPSKIDENFSDQLATDIAIRVQGDSLGLPGDVQSYAIQAIVAGKVKTRLAVRMNNAEVEGEGYDSEPATKTGHLAQLMRHNEVILKSFMLGQSHTQASHDKIIGVLASQNTELLAHNKEMEQHRLRNLELQEALLTNQHERDLEVMEQERKEKTYSELLDTVKLLGPAFVNRMGKGKNGQKLLPETASPNELAFKALIESLSEKQKMAFLGTLKESQKVALMELFKGASENTDKSH